MKKVFFVMGLLALILGGCDSKASNQDKENVSVSVDDVETKGDVIEPSVGTTAYDLKVEGKCTLCKERIEKAAFTLAGVDKADWSLETKELTLHLDTTKVSLDQVSKSIALIGHDTKLDRAKDKVYDGLPEMCKYRE